MDTNLCSYKFEESFYDVLTDSFKGEKNHIYIVKKNLEKKTKDSLSVSYPYTL